MILHIHVMLAVDSCQNSTQLQVDRPIRLTNIVVPNSNPLGIKRFVSGISISFKCECNIIMQIQYTKNLKPKRFELGTTLS